jgi:hypothetical protein
VPFTRKKRGCRSLPDCRLTGSYPEKTTALAFAADIPASALSGHEPG